MDASGSQPGYRTTGGRVRGRSLNDVLHDPGTGIAQQTVIPLDPSRVALIAGAILKALAAGTVHGYISPHTILLTDDGDALLVGDRVTPGATPANDVFALGMALFEAVEGYAPHPAEPLPAMRRAGMLAPLITALTERDASRRPDAAAGLEMLRAAVAGAAAEAAAAADVTETRNLPRVGADAGSGSGSGAGSGARAAGPVGAGEASADTSVLPRVPAEPITSPGPPLPPDYSAAGYAAYEDYPQAKRRALLIGGGFAAVVIVAGVALGVTQPWHKTDTSSSTVPGVPVSASVPATPATTSGTTSPSPSPSPTPTPTPTVSTATTLVSMSLCLDAAMDAGGLHSGARVSAGACHGSPNQAWQIHTDGTIHSMADPALCLDAAAPTGKVLGGAQVSAWTCHGGPNQTWVWNAGGTVSPAADTKLCLDAAGPLPIHAGANVTAWPCNGGPNEKWAKQ